MKTRSIALFWAIELNLLLWMAVFGLFFFGGFDNQETVPAIKGAVIAGIILAAFLQHWTYYNIYKPHKQQKNEKREKAEPGAQADRKG
jgi:hypothetical protein